MSDRAAGPLADCVRAAVWLVTRSPDADLLAAFAQANDPAAFEELVRRHAPLVLSACRSILPNLADADDACQATFVVLYRKAATIRAGNTLSAWLFRVARRAALEVKRSAQRRRDGEARAARPEPVPAPDLSWREAVAILHEELDQLPDNYRLSLILCYLEGKTQDEAARALGWSPDALRGRIDRGRAKLAERLRHRGIALSAGLLAAAATASIAPADVARRVMETVAAPSPAVRAVVHALAGSAGRTWAAAGVVSIGAVLAAGIAGIDALSGPPESKPRADKADVAPREVRLDLHGDPLPDGAVARLGTVRFNHGANLRALYYTPNSREILSYGNGQFRLWDVSTGKELRRFPVKVLHDGFFFETAFDGTTLVIAQHAWGDGPLVGYDAQTGKEVFRHTFPIARKWTPGYRRDALSPDGRLLACNTSTKLHVVETATAKELWAHAESGKGAQGISFAGPDRLVVAYEQPRIEVWDARQGKRLRSFESTDPVFVITGSPDGRLAATVSHPIEGGIDRFREADVVQVWDLETGTRKHVLKARKDRYILGLLFAPDSKTLATHSFGRDGQEYTVWDVATGERSHESSGPGLRLGAFSPDGRWLAAGSESGKFDVYDARTGRASSTVPAGGQAAVHLSVDGGRVTTFDRDSLSTWDGTTGRLLGKAAVPENQSGSSETQVSPDGRYVLIESRSGDTFNALLWDVAARQVLHSLPLGDSLTQRSFAFSPDSARFAIRVVSRYIAKPDGTITVRDVRSGKEVISFQDPGTQFTSKMSFTPDGRGLVVAGRRIAGFSVSDGKEQFTWHVAAAPPPPGPRLEIPGADQSLRSNYRQFAIAPDGVLAAYTLDGGMGAVAGDRMVLCDVRSGRTIHRWNDGATTGWASEYLVFSPDSRLLATSDDTVIHLWETATGKKVRSFRGHRNKVLTLAFSPNGRRLASPAQDGTTLIWDVASLRPGNTDLPGWWSDHSSTDPAIAWAAVWRLADAPDDAALPLLRKHLRPVTAADMDRVRTLVADLDSDQFRVRDRAFKDLSDLGHHAGPVLRAALDRKPSAEARQRIEQLLSKIVGPPSAGELVRTWRALAALEAKGTPGATQLLRELAAGADGAWLTHEAKAALRRVERR